jgi:Mlc titration factor MtfA (ptsG expression regulator)
MITSLLERWRRDKRIEIPEPEWRAALATLPCAQTLPEPQRARLRELVAGLLADKQFESAAEVELTAAMQLAIAVQACLPVLELGLAWYRGWTSIVVYPGEFRVPRSLTDEAGVVHEFEDTLSGESWDGGPVIVSWADAQSAGTAQAYSVVIHEFAHKLDMLDGEADGVPPFDRRLHPTLSPATWRAALADALARLEAELELIESELPPHIDPDSTDADPWYARLPLDPYAVQDEAEFFAVSAEAFFVAPAALQAAFPAWYAQLAAFFRQDPLSAAP